MATSITSPMRYKHATAVTSPQAYVSNIKLIADFKESGVTIAQLDWEGDECYAIRWNASHAEHANPNKKSGKDLCIGMPNSSGHSVWFILPDWIFDCGSDEFKQVIQGIKNIKDDVENEGFGEK